MPEADNSEAVGKDFPSVLLSLLLVFHRFRTLFIDSTSVGGDLFVAEETTKPGREH